jgi:hypothetical protein
MGELTFGSTTSQATPYSDYVLQWGVEPWTEMVQKADGTRPPRILVFAPCKRESRSRYPCFSAQTTRLLTRDNSLIAS